MNVMTILDKSVEHARLVGRHHVLNIDESILTAVHFEQLEGLLDQVAQIVSLSLAVVNFVSQVRIFRLEQVHDWQNLSVVGHQGLANSVRAGHEGLQDFQGDADDFWVSRVQSSLDWDDELGDDW